MRALQRRLFSNPDLNEQALAAASACSTSEILRVAQDDSVVATALCAVI
jgi:hypothetical protein